MVLPCNTCDIEQFNLRQMLYRRASCYTVSERLRMQIVEMTISRLIENFAQLDINDTENAIFAAVHQVSVRAVHRQKFSTDIELPTQSKSH